ncbi:MAG: TonB family protein [Gammaproteobacteria bacterium]|nr:TonB family protein [Gammaproteobacteria bacterium]
MNPFVRTAASISSTERLATTLFFAVLLHGTVILGITFSGEEAPSDRGTTLEITLVNNQSNELPDEADYLAESNQRGAGNTTEQARPESAMSSPDSAVLDGTPDAPDWLNRLEASRKAQEAESLEPQTEPVPEERRLLTEGDSPIEVAADNATPAASTERMLVARLMTPGLEITEPVNETSQEPVARSEDVREKFISVNTRESIYAEYLDKWRKRVEQVGNQHYPEQARAQGLSGSLVLEVALNADGTIRDLSVRRPSEHPLFDESALRILRLASPFPAFSDAMQAETDVLRFVYEWRFGKEGSQGAVRVRREQ